MSDSSETILHFFAYEHLPPRLQEVSKRFADVAFYLHDALPQGDEKTAALRKLLEGKDAAVRARLGPRKHGVE